MIIFVRCASQRVCARASGDYRKGQATVGGCRVLVENNSTRLERLNQRIGAYKEAYKAFGLLLLLVSYIPLARFF